MPLDKVPVILGPTASGKTSVSFSLAELISHRMGKQTEIISADSRQVYKNVGKSTSYPPQQYLEKYRHYFVGELELGKSFSAGEFGIKGRQVIKEVQSRGAIPLIVGGSGLYLNSLVYGLFWGAEGHDDRKKQKEVRNYLNERLRKEGAESLLNELAKLDRIMYLLLERAVKLAARLDFFGVVDRTAPTQLPKKAERELEKLNLRRSR